MLPLVPSSVPQGPQTLLQVAIARGWAFEELEMLMAWGADATAIHEVRVGWGVSCPAPGPFLAGRGSPRSQSRA